MRDVYLDGAANTPLSKKAYKAMKPFMSQNFMGNSISTHVFGVKAFEEVEKARSCISSYLGVDEQEVFFTSGATESNNWAIRSIVDQWRAKNPKGGHIICSALEHDSVLRCCEQMRDRGIEVTFVFPEKYSRSKIFLKDIKDKIRDDTILICTMAVNNELGVANQINRITQYAKTLDIPTLVDCTQCFSEGGDSVRIGVRFPYATFLSFSAHKFYGPVGVGGLVSRTTLTPVIIGGGQEQGLRGGTTNVPGIIGMCAALKEMSEHDYSQKYHDLMLYLDKKVREELPGIMFNSWSIGSIVSINCSRILNASHLASMVDAYGVSVSAGSACDSQHDETAGEFNGSHVLRAIGLNEKQIRNTIRVSFTRYTKTKDIDKLIRALKDLVRLEKENKKETK